MVCSGWRRAFGSKRSEKQAKIGQMELISRATQPGLSHMGWTHGRVSHSDVPDRNKRIGSHQRISKKTTRRTLWEPTLKRISNQD
ncbi:hypothetical protein V6Z11_D06G225800 [Gossypium hirsutum]